MKLFMNEYDVDLARIRFSGEMTNLAVASETLYRLKEWTNSHSDGWAYWAKPRNAASRLQALIVEAQRRERAGYAADAIDCPEDSLKRALIPVKTFLTQQGVCHSDVIGR